jgi:hypothetical protein
MVIPAGIALKVESLDIVIEEIFVSNHAESLLNRKNLGK